MVNPYAKQLMRIAQAYRDAEARVITSFLKTAPSNKDHLPWLRAQAFKEYSAIKPILSALAKLYPEVDRGIDRHDFEELTEKLADETRHARLVMDLLEQLSGRRITSADLVWLPEDRKLAKIRGRFSKSYATLLHGNGTIKAKEIRRPDEALERAAITLTEGGSGALYQVCSELKKPGIEARIARVFRKILRDELEHKNSGVRALASLIKSKSAFTRAAAIIAAVSRQRLRMRNEQFGFPLSGNDLKTLERRARRSATVP
jgi:rubrerythrin